MTGSVVDIYDSSASNDAVDSIIWSGYPGQAGG